MQHSIRQTCVPLILLRLNFVYVLTGGEDEVIYFCTRSVLTRTSDSGGRADVTLILDREHLAHTVKNDTEHDRSYFIQHRGCHMSLIPAGR